MLIEVPCLIQQGTFFNFGNPILICVRLQMKKTKRHTLTTLCAMLVLACLPIFSFASNNPTVGSIVVDSITQVQPRCGLNNGSVTVFAHGSDHIFYSIDNGLTFQEDSIFVNLGIGDYAIIVTDGLACIQPYTVQLTNGPQVKIDDIDITCHEQNVSADINLNVTDGIPPFVYQWEGPSNFTSTDQDLINITPGEYRLTVTDDVGCKIEEIVQIPVCCGLSQGLDLFCPTDLYLECGNPENETLIENWLASATAFDGLQNVLAVTNNYNNSQDAFCTDIVTIRFYTKDQCDNETFCTADILIADLSVPTINCPQDITIDFVPGQNLNNIENWLQSASASDNCSGAFVENNFNSIDANFDCHGESVFQIDFVAMDQCDNADYCSSSITIAPAPEVNLICLQNLELQCNQYNLNEEINDWIATIRAEDTNGNTLPVSNDFEHQVNYVCGDVFEVNFVSYNYCNEPLHCLGYISIVDTEAPILNCDNHLDISAYANNKIELIEEWLTTIQATDNCSQAEVTHNFDPSALDYSCGVADNFIVKFEAIDECDNRNICLLSINIIANQIQLNIPEPMELTCNVNNPIEIQAWINSAKAINQFGEEFPLINDLDPFEISCVEPTMVNFSYEDECGNILEASSSIILSDVEAPLISCPDEFSILSFDLPNFDFDGWLAEFTADDICSNVIIRNDFNYAAFDGSCKEQQIVHFEAEDQCGNISECFVEVRISDYALPEVDCPDDIYLDSADPFAKDDLDLHMEKIISNTNSTLSFEYSEQLDFDRLDLLHESKEIEVMITATNECDEYDECSFKIFIDSEAQIFAPSIFSPNGDGENDRFSLFGNNHLVSIIELSIYDRFGNRIDHLTNVPINHPSLGWDGTFRGRPCEVGVYSYYALIQDLNGKEIEYFGTITLVR